MQKKKKAAVCRLSQREGGVYNNHLSLYIQNDKFISETLCQSHIAKTWTWAAHIFLFIQIYCLEATSKGDTT